MARVNPLPAGDILLSNLTGSMTSRVCLLLMLRSPRLGQVKTRLARHLRDEAALALYKAFVEDMLDSLEGCGADVALWVAPGDDLDIVREWLGDGRVYLPQPEGDLGAKMHHAFQWAFGQGYTAAAALGSDLPQLAPKTARDLARLLRSEPAFIGPCPDGGYWTIGFQEERYLPQAFTDMPWSTPELLALTNEVLLPIQPAILPAMKDMDTVEDLRELVANCDPGVARRTLALAGQLLG